jgi:hypothetical protein
MKSESALVLEELRSKLRPASVAQVGGFRPSADPLTSWFLKGVSLAGEGLPVWRGKPMFPLLQIRIDELPVIPEQLKNVALLVLFHNMESHPFDQPHGEGWLIREYATLDGLELLPELATPYRAFPVRWLSVNDDAPGWEDAWDILDLSAVNDDEPASDSFFEDFSRYGEPKLADTLRKYNMASGLRISSFRWDLKKKLTGCGRTTALAIFTNHQTASGDFHVSSTDKLTCFLWL